MMPVDLRPTVSLLWICVWLVIGCGTVRDNSRDAGRTEEELATELADVGARLFSDLIEEKGRLLDMEYALNHAARRACGDLARPHFGVLTGSPSTLDEDWLKDVAEKDGILGQELTIVHLVAGSPFERAGLRVGDELLSIDGQSPGSHSELHVQRMQTKSLSPTLVRYRRGEDEETIEIPIQPTCPVTFSLSKSEALVTKHAGSRVYVPRGLMAFARDDDTLAISLAHGLAHALWDRTGASPIEQEQKADLFGTQIASRAGFDVSKTIAYWEDVARAYPWLILPKPALKRRRGAGSLEAVLQMLEAGEHYAIARRMEGLRFAVAQTSKR